MASIGNTLASTAASSATAAGSTSSTASTASTASSDGLANQSTFLQLLVAQLQNQDPTQPMDGTTFVTQLAQFSDVEQNLGTRQDLDAFSQQYLGFVPSQAAGTSASGSSAASSSGTTAAGSGS